MLETSVDNYHFREQITDNGMLFDYKIKQGISNTRNAIKLLRYMDFDSVIVENAEKLADK
jgi:DNA mismatch repair ATPase MutS